MEFLENLTNLQLSVWDILDILIIWFIIYSLFRFLRGRRTMQMAVGLFALFTARFLAEWLNLVVVHQIISSLLNLIPVAIIVLFQDELRRILTSLGTTSFLIREEETDKTILEKVFQAAINLARNRVGALFVLENEQGLVSYSETGTRLDALVSTELLVDIFNPKSNLHDGAVTISHDRIAAAACILPLTRSSTVPKRYGTRHRAAIGVTEEADCTVVVVSEETGKISFTKGGQIFTMEEDSLPILMETYTRLQQTEGEERTESIRTLTKKPHRKRRHGKVKKAANPAPGERTDETPTTPVASRQKRPDTVEQEVAE